MRKLIEKAGNKRRMFDPPELQDFLRRIIIQYFAIKLDAERSGGMKVSDFVSRPTHATGATFLKEICLVALSDILSPPTQ
jgi:hypothetical protein